MYYGSLTRILLSPKILDGIVVRDPYHGIAKFHLRVFLSTTVVLQIVIPASLCIF